MKALVRKISVFVIMELGFAGHSFFAGEPTACLKDYEVMVRYLSALPDIPKDMTDVQTCEPSLKYMATFVPTAPPKLPVPPFLPQMPPPLLSLLSSSLSLSVSMPAPTCPILPPAPEGRTAIFVDIRSAIRSDITPKIQNPAPPLSLPSSCVSAFRPSNAFLSNRFEPRCGLSSTRISIASGDSPNRDVFAPLYYLIEFPPSRINFLPRSIQEAVVTQYPGINLHSGLLAGLIARGVENIFISACGFGPIPNSRTPRMTTDEFRIIPHAFMAACQFTPLMDASFSGDVFIGIFESNGVIPTDILKSFQEGLGIHPFSHQDWIRKDDILVRQILSFDKSRSKCLPDVLNYQLINHDGGIGSLYVLAITPDRKNILVTHVLLINDRTIAEQIAGLFISEPTFKETLDKLNQYVRNPFLNPKDSHALNHTVLSLANLSDNVIVHHFDTSIKYTWNVKEWNPILAPTGLTLRGRATRPELLSLPLKEFRKGERLIIRGNLKQGSIGIALYNSNTRIDQNTMQQGDFILVIGPEPGYEGEYVPVIVAPLGIIDAEITNLLYF